MMAYEPTVWKDHILSDNSYNITENADGTIKISAAGEVIQQGTKMSAENFNRMEQGIYDASKAAEQNSGDITGINENISDMQKDIIGVNSNIADILTSLNSKANSADVYTIAETDAKIIAKVAEIVAGAPSDFDTLKEMSDWIASHEGSAAEMNAAINANKTNIANIQAEIGDIETVLSSVVEVTE